jgi:hypothetical protein
VALAVNPGRFCLNDPASSANPVPLESLLANVFKAAIEPFAVAAAQP